MFKTKSKAQIEQENQAALMNYLSQGNKVTKCPTYKTPPKKSAVKVVEIEVEHLPKALQQKFFKDEV